MEKSFYKKYFKIEKEHWLMVVRRMIARDNIEINFKKEREKIKILDFGCGSGILVDELARYGYQACGLDVSEEAIKFGLFQGIKNLEVINGYKINFQNNIFDAVFALDVLEHLKDEKLVLDEIKRVLKPGGVFIIMVPAHMFLWGVQDGISHHYRRYTMNSLLKKIEDEKAVSLKVLKKAYFNTFLFLPIAFFRIVSRIFDIKGRESDFDINSPLINRFFFSIFNFERKILKYASFPFGISILLVLKKENYLSP